MMIGVMSALLAACGASDNDQDDDAEQRGSSDGVAAAKADLATFEKQPTSITVTDPVSKPIPTGKKIYMVSCGLSTCETVGKALVDAAKVLGWEMTVLTTDGTPAQIQNAYQQAVRDKPDGLVVVGTDPTQIAPYLKQLQDDGTAVVGLSIPKATNGILWVGNGETEYSGFGRQMAAFAVADAADKGLDEVSTLVTTVSDFPVLVATADGFEEGMKQYCPKCSVDVVSIGAASISAAPETVVSYLRSHPDVKYMAVSGAAVWDSATKAIKSAGLDVTIIGSTPTETTLADMKAGDVAAATAYPQLEAPLSALDALARHFVGDDIPDSKMPQWIITEDTIPTGAYPYAVVPGYLEQYRALWGK